MADFMIYQVAVGKPSKLYEHCINSVAEYCKKWDIDHIVQREPILRIKPDIFAMNRSTESYEKYGGYLPIYEKENAFNYLDKYQKIAVIDADIWIRPDSPNVFTKFNAEFGAVCEREMPIANWYAKKIVNYSGMQYHQLAQKVNFKPNNLGYEFFNMGMMLLGKGIKKYLRGQDPHSFLMRAEFKDFVDGKGNWKWSTDQTLLNYWIKNERMNVQHMDWRWNGLYTANTKIKECHFVHFFLKDKLPDRGENVKELMKEVQ